MIKTIEFDLSASLEEPKDVENLDAGDGGSVSGDEGESGRHTFNLSSLLAK